ncbi:MAG: type IV toxin-antitoxin system AbiEi family antitoxin domain-containing protein [Gammaproteobacteria bacterium]|nr:type IV toxin-antitoxin system AbiEi family antitoxin domain-containing protein [Gammaproteobacteria bacterium]
MVLAEACNHAWVKKLGLSKVDFGKGKRMIVKGGRLDTKYNITVPDANFQWKASVNSAGLPIPRHGRG